MAIREIIFRGKSTIYNDIWYVGDFGHIWQGVPCIVDGTGTHEVIPETVGQYTGLTDCNGEKIFEGDILKVRQLNSEDFEIAKICFGEFNEDKTYYLGFYAELKDGMQFSLVGGKSIVSNLESFYEVIGNIHANPELLEV